MNGFGGISDLTTAKRGRSRSVNAENPTGEKGKGGMAPSNLGPSRKGSPCLRNLASGSVTTLADIKGPGVINHIWITVADQTEKDYYVLRDLVLRMYWDDEETPSVESPLGDFFCCGFARDCIVNSLPICVVPARGFNCYFQMPFGKRARSHWKISTRQSWSASFIRLIIWSWMSSRRIPYTSMHSGAGRS